MPRKKKAGKALTVVALSGSTGRTCDEVLQAALAQFEEPNVDIVRKTKVRTLRAAVQAVKYAAEHNAVICHSIVAPKIRQAVVQETEKRGVPTIDILGPVLTVLEDHLEQAPRLRAGLSYQLGKENYDRVDAVNFTLAHDDGCGLVDLAKADVVIVGVSRSSKSVTCFYLAYRGIRAANVPLIPGCEPPAELLALPSEKVIGLTMNANRLCKLRGARIQVMGNANFEKYGDMQQINEELRYATALMSMHSWRRIDVSYTSVEEIAKEIVATVRG